MSASRSRRGEIYGLAGESSSGKTTLIKTIAAAIQPPLEVLAGSVTLQLPGRRDRHAARRPRRAGGDPLAASVLHHAGLDERAEPGAPGAPRLRRLRLPPYRPADAASSSTRCARTWQRLQLEPDVLDAYPHELSGGMRQRVTIALATVCRPEFIIADEPTTALDVVVQKDVLAMIREIQRELGSSILFVTHDMAVHANLADRLGIMYAGRLVEEGRTADIFRSAAPSLHRAPDREPAAAGRHRAQGRPRRRAAQPRRSAAGLPLPSALPARHGHLPPRGAAAGRRSRRAIASPASIPSRRRMSALLELDQRQPPLRRRPVLAPPGHGGARRQPAAGGGTAGDLHRRRRIGQRQDHARPHDPEHGAAERRRDPLPGHRPRDPPRRAGAAAPSCARSSRSSRTRSRPSTR